MVRDAELSWAAWLAFSEGALDAAPPDPFGGVGAAGSGCRCGVELPPISGKFPTGALASYRFASEWRRLKPHTATLIAYVTPRELEDDRA